MSNFEIRYYDNYSTYSENDVITTAKKIACIRSIDTDTSLARGYTLARGYNKND